MSTSSKKPIAIGEMSADELDDQSADELDKAAQDLVARISAARRSQISQDEPSEGRRKRMRVESPVSISDVEVAEVPGKGKGIQSTATRAIVVLSDDDLPEEPAKGKKKQPKSNSVIGSETDANSDSNEPQGRERVKVKGPGGRNQTWTVVRRGEECQSCKDRGLKCEKSTKPNRIACRICAEQKKTCSRVSGSTKASTSRSAAKAGSEEPSDGTKETEDDEFGILEAVNENLENTFKYVCEIHDNTLRLSADVDQLREELGDLMAIVEETIKKGIQDALAPLLNQHAGSDHGMDVGQ